VLHNIQQYQQQCNGTNITVSLRPATSALTIGYYVGLLQYALEHKLIIKSNQVYRPDFLNVSVLPRTVKNIYISQYQEFLDKLSTNTVTQDYNASDPNNYVAVIQEHAQACVNALQAPDQTHLLPALVAHCQKWDQVYKYNAWELYPEWQNFLEQHGYTVAS
jgi:hypothetical protein